MVFCGQCGHQLAPGTTTCPDCGAAVDTDMEPVEDVHADDATVASLPYIAPTPSQPNTQPPPPPPSGPSTADNQQRLVLGAPSDSEHYNYGTQGAYTATNRVDAQPNYGTRTSSSNPNTSYPNFTSQPQNAYSGYPSRSDEDYYPQEPAGMGRPTRGRTTGLTIILLGVLLILIAVILFALQQSRVISFGGGGAAGGGSPSTSSTQPQVVVQQFYSDIDQQDYEAAYNLFHAPGQSLQNFKDGYMNTKKDDLTIGEITKQSNGTEKVAVALVATELLRSGKLTTSTYHGYYIVQSQNDGSWKILSGYLNKAL